MGAVLGAEFGFALWLGYNLGVLVHRYPMGVASPVQTGGMIALQRVANDT